MIRRFAFACLAALSIVAGIAPGARAAPDQPYPSQVIRILTSGAGGPGDVISRLVAGTITHVLGQPVIVVNQAPILAYDEVAKARPDGYTLLYAGAYFTTLKLLQPQVPADPVRDFAPITEAEQLPCIVTVNPGLPAKTLTELISLVKSKPGALNFSSSPIGTASDLAGILFKYLTHTDFVTAYYPTDPASALATVTGETQMTIDVVPTLWPHIPSGKLRALAVTTAQPTALAPGVPTVGQAGLPDFQMEILNGFLAPAHTPKPIIDRLNHEIVRALSDEKLRQVIASSGGDPVANSPEQFAALIKADVEKWALVFKQTGKIK